MRDRCGCGKQKQRQTVILLFGACQNRYFSSSPGREQVDIACLTVGFAHPTSSVRVHDEVSPGMPSYQSSVLGRVGLFWALALDLVDGAMTE